MRFYVIVDVPEEPYWQEVMKRCAGDEGVDQPILKAVSMQFVSMRDPFQKSTTGYIYDAPAVEFYTTDVADALKRIQGEHDTSYIDQSNPPPETA